MKNFAYEYLNANIKLWTHHYIGITLVRRMIIFIFFALLLIVFLAVQAYAAAHQITQWVDNRAGAVSLTFDDCTYSSQYTLAVPALNTRGLKGTFFLITGGAAWSEWRDVASQGHEIGSYTVSHADLSQLSDTDIEKEMGESKDTIDAHIAMQRCLTFSYPFGSYYANAKAIADEYYIAARGISCDLNASPYDFYGMKACSDSLSLTQMKAKADTAEQQGKWLISYFHSLDGTGYGNWTINTFTAYLGYLLTKNLWADSFSSIAKYARERESASLSLISSSEDQIVLRLADGLNNNIFDEPLTIRSEVPISWTKVRVKKGGSARTVTPIVEGAQNVIYYSAVPDWGLITLENNVLYLSVQKTGTGQGSVTNNSYKINCGSICSASFSQGTAVTLTAAASTGSTFSGWTGCDSVSGTNCTVTMTATRTINANFALNQHTLTALKTGTGSGTLTAYGLSCTGATCTRIYNYGDVVTVTPTADMGSTFGGWTGCDSVTDNICTILVNGDRDITATFHRVYTLVIKSEGTGNGKITSAPSFGIDCEPEYSNTFIMGTPIELTAWPDDGSVFAFWSGGCTGTTETCDLILTGDTEVSANFVSYGTRQYRLIVKRANKNQGDGIVTSTDRNIDCGDTCSKIYYKDTIVTLSAEANEDSTFIGWKPDILNCADTVPCTIKIDQAKTVKAVFVGAYGLKIINQSKRGGIGVVSSIPSGISCSTGNTTGCEAAYKYGQEVTLSASAGTGSVFLGWIPAKLCPVSGDCTLLMKKKQSVKAVFLGQ